MNNLVASTCCWWCIWWYYLYQGDYQPVWPTTTYEYWASEREVEGIVSWAKSSCKVQSVECSVVAEHSSCNEANHIFCWSCISFSLFIPCCGHSTKRPSGKIIVSHRRRRNWHFFHLQHWKNAAPMALVGCCTASDVKERFIESRTDILNQESNKKEWMVVRNSTNGKRVN